MKLHTEEEVARALHKTKRWLSEWLRENPSDDDGPFYVLAGSAKRFTGAHILRVVRAVVGIEATERSDQQGYIYLVDDGEKIKIGFSRALEDRMKMMRTHAPACKLLHAQPGTFKTEKVLHRHFAVLRIAGEWFRKDPQLLEYIEQQRGIA